MHNEILSKTQVALLPLLAEFSKDFALVGGTAIALHLGHRQSVDFDLFSYDDFTNSAVKRKIAPHATVENILVNYAGEYTIVANGVKVTFLTYPYNIEAEARLGRTIRMPDLLTLAAMKAFALGRRAKWKDYVDIYYITKAEHSLAQIADKGKEIFGGEWNEKIFRESLSYFDDIDYSEKVIFMPQFAVDEQEIKKALTALSIN